MADYSKADVLRFLNQECSEEEAIGIKNYLSTHPEILADLLTWEDWIQVREKKVLTPKDVDSYNMWESLRRRISHDLVWKKSLVMAAVLCFCILIWQFFKPNELVRDKDTIVSNNSSIIKEIVLMDSSIVELYPHSKIKIDREYNLAARCITVWGKGAFKVAKNKHKPFVVMSGILKTTALGTYFLIDDAYSDRNTTFVRLFEGKIKISNGKDSILLIGNDSISYNKCSNLFNGKLVYKKISNTNGKKLAFHRDSTLDYNNLWYKFNNQSLGTVFERLGTLYDAKIEFDDAEKDSVYFIGQFKKTDSLNDILQTITVLHGWKLITLGENKYKIVRD